MAGAAILNFNKRLIATVSVTATDQAINNINNIDYP